MKHVADMSWAEFGPAMLSQVQDLETYLGENPHLATTQLTEAIAATRSYFENPTGDNNARCSLSYTDLRWSPIGSETQEGRKAIRLAENIVYAIAYTWPLFH